MHLTGDIAVQVDQQKANGNQGGQIEKYSSLLIILLLVLIFRSLTLALVTLAPAFLSVVIAGPLVAEAAQHGLRVSPIAQFLMIVLVLGAGTDYGLFLVFRVREQLRSPGTDGGPGPSRAGPTWRRPREPRPGRRSSRSITRSGSPSASPLPRSSPRCSRCCWPVSRSTPTSACPFAIAIGVTLLAALTLLPALLSIRLSLLGVKRTLFQRLFGRAKLLPWNIQGSGKTGSGARSPAGSCKHPLPTLLAGLMFFGGLAFGVTGYKAAGFGGSTTAPAHTDSAKGQALLDEVLPAGVGESDRPDLPVRPADMDGYGGAWPRHRRSARRPALHSGDRAA